MPGEKVRPWRGAAIGRGTAMTGAGSAAVAALAPPLAQDLVRVEPEVERVVAQEALGVDRAGQLLVVAALEGAQVARPDLGVALGAVQVDALALARGVQALGQASGRARRRRHASGVRPVDPDRPLELLVASSSVVPVESVVRAAGGRRSSRRSTGRAFEPSNGPDVAPRLQLVDHPGGPRVADLQAALEERRRGPIVLPNDLDGIRQQSIGVLVGEVVDRAASPSSPVSMIAMS